MSLPQMDRKAGLRRPWLRVVKSARILARQVRRAGVIVNQAPPLLHNGKAAR